jgi:hypothetical protein
MVMQLSLSKQIGVRGCTLIKQFGWPSDETDRYIAERIAER